MTSSPGSQATSGQTREQDSPPRAATYQQAESTYRATTAARERFEELTTRDLLARSCTNLKARGEYDPHKHVDPDQYPPLTAEEHLEILAAGEMLARHYRHPARVHQAVLAGASWPQIAAAAGTGEAQARRAYREWADGQHLLHADYHGKFGLNDAEHAAAVSRAADPPAAPEAKQEAGQ